MSTQILLRPRPYAQYSGTLLLLPLLPHRKPLKPLPSEIWTEIFAFALQFKECGSLASSLLRVCKGFKDIALPLIYSDIHITCIATLEKFQERLHLADQKWDSIRRIPYSTPGRWVQALDLSSLVFVGQSQALQVDSLLTHLFPLIPFLSCLSMNPSFVLSRRAVSSLARREGAVNICTLRGLSYVYPHSSSTGDDDYLVQLLRYCTNLEELEIIGQGLDPADLEFTFEGSKLEPSASFSPLILSKLHTLSLLSMHSSPLMMSLLLSPLSALRKLTITPYDDVPYPISLASKFISTHGETLRSLLLLTPKSWPTRRHPSPATLLDTSPRLRHLSLENPLPALTYSGTHPLQILSIPRPNAESWEIFQKLLIHLPNICVLRTRDVRWLRKGMNSRAQEAGVQGEMREWRKRLSRRGIRLLDADWHENE